LELGTPPERLRRARVGATACPAAKPCMLLFVLMLIAWAPARVSGGGGGSQVGSGCSGCGVGAMFLPLLPSLGVCLSAQKKHPESEDGRPTATKRGRRRFELDRVVGLVGLSADRGCVCLTASLDGVSWQKLRCSGAWRTQPHKLEPRPSWTPTCFTPEMLCRNRALLVGAVLGVFFPCLRWHQPTAKDRLVSCHVLCD